MSLYSLVPGILVVPLLPALPEVPVLAVLGVLAAASLAISGRGGRCLSGLLLGVLLGLVAGHLWQARRLPPDCELVPLVAQGRVDSLPRTSVIRGIGKRQRFEFVVDVIEPARCRGPARLLLSWYEGPDLVAGTRWQLPLRLRRPWGLANPGSFNMQAWYTLSGIDAVGTVRRGGALALPGEPALGSLHHRLRAVVSARIAALPLDSDIRALLQAVTVADRSGLDYRLWSLLQTFGLNHLAVISGLHVGMVAAVGFGLGGLFARGLWLLGYCPRPWLRCLLALLPALAYAALAGFTLATVRALSMLACFTLALAAGRPGNSWHNWGLAAVLVLLLNPLAGLGSGFWLSFASVACLLWLARLDPLAPWWRRLPRTHLYMALAMLPLGALWFGGASRFSAPANLLIVPLVGLWVVPLSLAGTFCALLGLPLAEPLLQLSGWPLAWLLPMAESLAASHTELLYMPLRAEPLTLALGALGVLVVAIRGSPFMTFVGLTLLLPLLLPSPAPERPGRDLRVTVLDVGQGTAVVLRSGDRVLLYDTGGGDAAGSNMANSVILPYLRHIGMGALSELVISHRDLDHSAGAATVLAALPVGRVWQGSGPLLRRDARRCRAGVAWRWPGGVSFQLLSPSREPGLASNDGSCVLQVRFAGHRLLLPGDVGARRERALVQYWQGALASDWLLAGHHGSATSSSLSWLKTVAPSTAVFSHGYRNRFGHPHPDVLARYRELGISRRSTAAEGALEFVFSPDGVSVHAHRERLQRYWK